MEIVLKEKLSKNKLTIGSWITIGHPSVVEIMASAGFEWLVIDMEHTSISLETAQILTTTIQANKMQALVRVSKNEEVIIKRVMDCGADGVIVPMINSKAEAEKAVSYVKYPPYGRRGVGLYRAQKYGIGFNEYKKWVKESSVIIAQVEHIDAVENIEGILQTKGVDGIIIGPYDLSASMGYPGEYNRSDVKNAVKKVKQACKKFNKPYGFHVIDSDPDKLMEKVDDGCVFLSYSVDFFFLGDCARYGMDVIKKRIGKI
jgi:2-dehydro-3-deoxyglucarate aldolase